MRVYRITTNEFFSWKVKMGRAPQIEILEEEMHLGSEFFCKGKYWDKERDVIFYVHTY